MIFGDYSTRGLHPLQYYAHPLHTVFVTKLTAGTKYLTSSKLGEKGFILAYNLGRDSVLRCGESMAALSIRDWTQYLPSGKQRGL